MKYCIVIADGVAGVPLDELDGKTPLAAAATPNLDRVSALGRQGTLQTAPDGLEPGVDVSVLSILGTDPLESHPGRAAFEAAGLGIELDPNCTAFCCSLVTVVDGTMLDATAGNISSAEAEELVGAVSERLATADVSFHRGTRHQHLMVYSGREDLAAACVAPHRIIGEKVNKFAPRGAGERILRKLMEQSCAVLEGHDVNLVRIDHGESPATMMWLWGGGRAATVQPFAEQCGKTCVVISASHMVRGIARHLGIDCVEIKSGDGEGPGSTAAAAEAAISSLDRHDIAVLHIGRVDESGHSAGADEMVRAIEDIDDNVVGRILGAHPDDEDFRVLIVACRPAHAATETGTQAPVPFAMCGAGIQPIHELAFCENSAAGTGLRIEHGHELMAYFLRQ